MTKKMFLAGAPFLLLLITGCGSRTNGLPLPASAKSISGKTIQVPFPYSESSNGEPWVFSRGASDQNSVVEVLNGGKIVDTFRVDAGSNPSITLGGDQYTVTAVTLNNDNTSGVVTLVKK